MWRSGTMITSCWVWIKDVWLRFTRSSWWDDKALGTLSLFWVAPFCVVKKKRKKKNETCSFELFSLNGKKNTWKNVNSKKMVSSWNIKVGLLNAILRMWPSFKNLKAGQSCYFVWFKNVLTRKKNKIQSSKVMCGNRILSKTRSLFLHDLNAALCWATAQRWCYVCSSFFFSHSAKTMWLGLWNVWSPVPCKKKKIRKSICNKPREWALLAGSVYRLYLYPLH